MSNNTTIVTATVIATLPENIRDEAWESYLESLNYLDDGIDSLAGSFRQAEKIRDSYRRWICKKLDEIYKARNECPPDKVELFDFNNDPSFLEKELAKLQHADDSGINRWDTREQLDDLEYGIIDNVPREQETGTTGYLDLADTAKLGPELTWVNPKSFVSKADAQAFVDRTRAAFKKGDHSAEIIGTEVRKGHAEPFVAIVLEADGNWDHRKALAAARNNHLENAVSKVAKCTTRQQLNKVAGIAKRYSRDSQVLASGKTSDGSRKVGIGFDYKRYATVMNAIAERATELGIDGFRTYQLKEFSSTRQPTDGDALSVGCRVGSWLGEEKPEDDGPSLWELKERTFKPYKPLAPTCLVFHNPDFPIGPQSELYSNSKAA